MIHIFTYISKNDHQGYHNLKQFCHMTLICFNYVSKFWYKENGYEHQDRYVPESLEMRTKAMEVEILIVSFSVFSLALENIQLILFKRKA